MRYTRKGIRQSLYLRQRYQHELLAELYTLIAHDKDYVDDVLFSGGIFMYRNTPKVQAALKEWWYYQSRYILQDQVSFPYVLRKAELRINVRPDSYGNAWFAGGVHHTRRS